MANNCEYDLRIKGSKEALELFENIITYGGDEDKSAEFCKNNKYFYRIFSAEKYDFSEDGTQMSFAGDCAWSVASSFQLDGEQEFVSPDENQITLSQFCKEHQCECEVWSEEPGLCFAEHLHILPDGTKDVDDCLDYQEEYNEETDEYDVTVKPDNFWEFDYL